MKALFRVLIASLICTAASAPVLVQAADKLSGQFYISTGPIVPMTISHTEGTLEVKGFAGEIVTAALKKAGLDGQFKVKWAPWKRAQDETQKTPNAIIFPITRTKERETQYKWVAAMWEVNCHAWAIDPAVKIDTLDDVKKLKIGALAGSPPEFEVKKLLGDAAGMEGAPDEDTNFKKLAAGRIQAWSTQEVVAPYVSKAVSSAEGKPVPALRKGVKFFAQTLWIAVNKDTSDADIAVLKKAFEDFQKDPQFKEIMSKYTAL